MAFTVFPKEVWEVIMGNLGDSIDILNTFQAFPELETKGVLRTKRHLWLFERIVPHIFPWVNLEREKQSKMRNRYCYPPASKEVMPTLRLVCKLWCRGVDHFLENNSTLRAYSHTDQPTGQLWIPEASTQYYKVPHYFLRVKPFDQPGRVSAFLQLMDGHPPEINPFPGRSIKISDRLGFGTGQLQYYETTDITAYWNEGLDLIRKYGSHVWFLNLKYFHKKDPIHFSQLVMDSLTLVPNLKSLRIGYFFESQKAEAIDDFLNSGAQPLSELPHLETLELAFDQRKKWTFPPTLWNKMVEAYHSQIRRLKINKRYWRKEYSEYFPNLTEFTIIDVGSGDSLPDFINSLNFPDLWKLHIKFKKIGLEDSHMIRLNKVIPPLKKFPRLHTLTFSVSDRLQGMTFHKPCSPIRSFLTSVKNLEIVRCAQPLPYQLFQYFPQLEHLKVVQYGYREIQNEMYKSKIWDELFPKLRMIRIDGNRTRYYSRANYVIWNAESVRLALEEMKMTKQKKTKQGRGNAPRRSKGNEMLDPVHSLWYF